MDNGEGKLQEVIGINSLIVAEYQQLIEYQHHFGSYADMMTDRRINIK